MQIGSFSITTDSLIPRATALHGTPILVADTLPASAGQSMMRGADSLTDDSAGNAYFIFDSPPYISGFPSSITPTIAVLAKITSHWHSDQGSTGWSQQ